MGNATEEETGSSEVVPVQHKRPTRRGWPRPTWEREIDEWFGQFNRLFPWPRLWGPTRLSAPVEGRLAAADLYETADEVVVKADLPGISKDDVEVILSDSTLILKGERREDETIRDEEYHFRERAFGAFARAIDLPVNVRPEQAKATISNGVLEIRVPKTEQTKRKEVKVQVR